MSADEPFAAVLREKLAELDADERAGAEPADALDDFRAATQRAVIGEGGQPLPRVGHHAYVQPPQPVAASEPRALDIRF